MTKLDDYNLSSPVSVNTVDWTQFPNLTKTFSIEASGAGRKHVAIITLSYMVDKANNEAGVQIRWDGNPVENGSDVYKFGSANAPHIISVIKIVQPSAGNHTLAVFGRVASSTVNVIVSAVDLILEKY